MISSTAQIENLALRNPLAYGISYVDLLQNTQWQIKERRWATDIYQAVNPYEIERNPTGKARRLVIMKSTQCGMSTMGINRVFHFTDFWDVRVMYTLPRQQDVIDFVSTRVDPMIQASPRLLGRLGMPKSTHAKRLGNSFIFFMELSVEPRMMPADALYIDEVDLSDPTFMATAQNRLDASQWKLNYFFSTPTLPNFGIDGLYHSSDMNRWMVGCSHCGFKQQMDWDKNLLREGPAMDPTRVWYGCQKCGKEITKEDIQMGEWVAEFPSRSDTTVGYHVSQLMTHSAPDLYKIFIDPQTKLVEFYRKRLGKPYEVGGGEIGRVDFLENCFDEPYKVESEPDNVSTYYMGVDQGNALQVVLMKRPPNSSRLKVVDAFVIPNAGSFDPIIPYINKFKVKKIVVDNEPNTHSAERLQKMYPGRVVRADYVDQKQRIAEKKLTNGVIDMVMLGRTEAMDDYIDRLRRGQLALPGSATSFTEATDLVINQTLNMRRDVLMKRTHAGNEEQVGVWRALGPDHFAHAMVYAITAYDLSLKGNFRAQEVGPALNEDGTRKETIAVPKKNTKIRIL